MRHPMAILGVRNDFLTGELNFKQGVNHMSVEELSELSTKSLIIGCREQLEGNTTYRQILPYIIFVRSNPRTAKPEYFAYQRGKGIGEDRLLGNVSIGVGGHVDLADVVHSESVINLNATVGVASAREIKEEVVFTGGVERELEMFSAGMLIDDTNSVGQVHLGVLLVVTLPDSMDMVCAEKELDTLGFMSADELLAMDNLENWTRIALEHFVTKTAEKADADA